MSACFIHIYIYSGERVPVPLLSHHGGLGYYDLMDYKTRKKQAELAKEHHINGFIYHHYFFYKNELNNVLAKPLLQMLIDGEPNIPFAFNWAANSWTVTWHGIFETNKVIPVKLC